MSEASQILKEPTENISTDRRDGPESARLSEGWLRFARFMWAFLAVIALGVLVSSLPGYVLKIDRILPGHGPIGEPSMGYVYLQVINTIVSLASSLLSLYLALVLFRRKFESPAVMAVSIYLLLYGMVMTGPLEHWGFYWLGEYEFAIRAQTLLMATPTAAMLFLFPNGRFVPKWSRWILIASLPWSLFALLVPVIPYRQDQITNLVVMASLWVCLLGLGVYSQVYRYRRVSSNEERRQTRWVLYGFALWLGYLLLSAYPYLYLTNLPPESPQPWWSPVSESAWWLSLNILPVTLTIAITRARLWNIDNLINRTLVYATLTLATMALYLIVVGASGRLLHAGDSALIPFLTAGLIAFLFQPLRESLQVWVNRLMYGHRDDPYTVLTSLGQRLENSARLDAILPAMVETIALTLKLPYVAISLASDEQEAYAAVHGEPPPYGLEEHPLLNQGEAIGTLMLARRSENEPFTPGEKRLLTDLARQVGVAANNVRLTADLQRSRQRIVTAREEERRRLRRDLHDGLGPQLASQTLALNAIEKLIERDPAHARRLVQEVRAQAQEAITTIRDLIYDLRPPALDELGLVGALQEGSANLHGDLRVEIDSPEPLPSLPAAVEAAAYHITREAILNTIRHAQASRCAVRLEIAERDLYIQVEDDGRGMPGDSQSGVGLQSMRERVSELNGRIQIDSCDGGGTRVRAWLPLPGEGG